MSSFFSHSLLMLAIHSTQMYMPPFFSLWSSRHGLLHGQISKRFNYEVPFYVYTVLPPTKDFEILIINISTVWLSESTR